MDEKQKAKNEAAEAADQKKDDGGGAVDDKARVKELEKENQELKQEVLALQKKLEEMEAERKAAANRTRAQKLIRKMEEQNISFGSDDEREKEIERLAGLSDEAFAATETAMDRMIRSNAEKAEKQKEEDGKDSAKTKTKAESQKKDTPMRSDAGVRPKDVDDQKNSLEDKLKNGFMAAYRHRVASAAGEPVATN